MFLIYVVVFIFIFFGVLLFRESNLISKIIETSRNLTPQKNKLLDELLLQLKILKIEYGNIYNSQIMKNIMNTYHVKVTYNPYYINWAV